VPVDLSTGGVPSGLPFRRRANPRGRDVPDITTVAGAGGSAEFRIGKERTVPPITVIFVVSGLAVWLNGLAFLGIGAKPAEDGPNPLTSVGWVTALAGIVDLLQAAVIIAVAPPATGIPLAGIVTFYGTFFTALGVTLVKGLDLRPVGNLAVAVAIVPLLWWKFFDGSWMLHSILVVWLVAFLAVAATTYGKLPGKVLGVILTLTSLYTFLTPAALLALGKSIP
jgi:hypothetical protein